MFKLTRLWALARWTHSLCCAVLKLECGLSNCMVMLTMIAKHHGSLFVGAVLGLRLTPTIS